MYIASEQRYEQMVYRRCGASGLKLSAISLGLWHNFGGVDLFENMRAMLCRAFDLGITHFDLANNYGNPAGASEALFGRILRDYYSRRPIPADWARPPEIEERDVDILSGGLAIAGCPPDRVSRELFLPGTAPPDCAEHHGGVVGFFERVGRWFGR